MLAGTSASAEWSARRLPTAAADSWFVVPVPIDACRAERPIPCVARDAIPDRRVTSRISDCATRFPRLDCPAGFRVPDYRVGSECLIVLQSAAIRIVARTAVFGSWHQIPYADRGAGRLLP